MANPALRRIISCCGLITTENGYGSARVWGCHMDQWQNPPEMLVRRLTMCLSHRRPIDPSYKQESGRTRRYLCWSFVLRKAKAPSISMVIFRGRLLRMEAEVKDESRFPGKWAFFSFETAAASAKPLPASASCYSCHAENGAVDNTFVQFYPTLLEVAKRKGTLQNPQEGSEAVSAPEH